jgi:serine/threonine protein kinase
MNQETKKEEIIPDVNNNETKKETEDDTKKEEIIADVNNNETKKETEDDTKKEEIVADVNNNETKKEKIVSDVNNNETKKEEIVADVNNNETKKEEIVADVNNNETEEEIVASEEFTFEPAEIESNKSFKPKFIKNKRYKLTKLIGGGAYSRVYEGLDRKNNKTVAIKMQHSGKYYNNCAKQEIKILRKITKGSKQKKTVTPPVIQLLTSFKLKKHYVMVFPLFGDDLHALKRRLFFEGKRLPLVVVKHIFKQVLRACMFTHTSGIVHTDIKCENVLLNKKVKDIDLEKFPLDDFKVVLTDFGTATEDEDHYTEYIQTLEMRAPEAIFNGDWDFKVDVWSLGCLLFELLTLNTLFSLSSNPFPHYRKYDELSSDEEAFDNEKTNTDNNYSEDSINNEVDDEDEFDLYLLLFKIQSLLGKPPLKPFESTLDFKSYYWCNDEEGLGYLKYFHNDTIMLRPMRQILIKDYGCSKKTVKQVEPFIMKMLQWNPKKRPTVYELLEDSFFK